MNGQPGLTVEVSKRTGENIIETVEKVRAVVERERQEWPSNIQVTYLQDQSTEIRNSLNDLTNNVIAAVLLVMVVVVGALGLRSGLLVGIAIPGSFLMAILVIGAAGLTINMVVLFGLILAVGMLVDGAIVVTEYADRKMGEGLHPARSLCSGRKAHGMARHRLHCHHAGGFPPAGLLDRRGGRVHEVPAIYAVGDPDGVTVHGADLRTHLGCHFRSVGRKRSGCHASSVGPGGK